LPPLFSRGEAKGKTAYWQKRRRGATNPIFAQRLDMDTLKDHLEELMDLKRSASITFRSVEGGVSTIKGHIVKMENVSGRDIIETDAGLVIGTDQILEINGRRFENIC
jgi:hypothetical protein